MKRLLISAILILFTFGLSGQDFGEFINPKPGDTLLNGQIILVFKINPEVNFKPASVDVLIDNVSFKYLMKIKGNKVSVLIRSLMKPGSKKLEFTTRDQEGNKYRQSVNFVVSRNRGSKENQKVLIDDGSDKTHVKADLKTSSRFTNVNGEGAALRQEPPEIHRLHFNASITRKKFEIPLKLFLTNHERNYLQARNRFLTGFKTKQAGILLGDVNPHYHPILLDGARVRGAEAYFRLRNAQFNVTYGTTKRAIEGLRNYYNSLEDESYPPVNLELLPNESDSIYLIQGYYNEEGSYRRKLLAANVLIGSPNTNNKVQFSFLKSTDDTTSIQYGGQAEQNIAFGVDMDFKDKTKKFLFKGGIAAALTTRDIRRGAAEKETIDDFYGTDIPVNPVRYKNLFIYNTTSTVMTWDHTPFLSYYFRPEYRLKNNSLWAELQRIGSDFKSFGNPYLINDRFMLTLADRMCLFQRHLLISIRLKRFNDNLSKANTKTYYTNLADASFNLMIKEKIPRITGGYRLYFKESRSTESNSAQYRIANYRLGLTQNFNIDNTANSVLLMLNRNDRYSFLQHNSVFTNALNIGISHHHQLGLNLSFQYNLMLLTTDSLDLNRNNTYNFRLGYRQKKGKFSISVLAGKIRTYETAFYPGSQRSFYSLDLEYRMLQQFVLSLELGNSVYDETGVIENDYNELWAELGLRYKMNRKY